VVKTKSDLLIVLFSLLGVLLLVFVLFPLVNTLVASRPAGIWSTLGDETVRSSLGLTFVSGAIATGFGLLTGVPLAYLLARRCFPGRHLVQGLIDLPVVIPHTAAGIALLMVFGRRGFFGRLMEPVGVRFTDSVAGIVVAMIFVSLPFLVNAAREAFELIDPELELIAQTEGASRWQAFWHVTLPLASRGILAGAIMMWARGISEFGAVVILSYHPQIVPILVYQRFQGFGLDAALPVAAILILTSLIVFTVIRALLASRQEAL
jgi:molybdate/tungstate transport system permease protein